MNPVSQNPSPRVALVSSTRAVFGPMEAAFRDAFPEARILHLLDETLIEDFRREGGLSAHSRRKALQMVLTAQEAGVDGILVTCSTLSPSVEDFRPFLNIPVVKIDEPVIEEAVCKAGTVGLVATAETVLKSVVPLVEEKGRRAGRRLSIRSFIRGDVWPLLEKDPAAFYRALGEVGARAARECDAVILTQVSIAPARDFVEEGLRPRVYASPPYAVRAIRKILCPDESPPSSPKS